MGGGGGVSVLAHEVVRSAKTRTFNVLEISVFDLSGLPRGRFRSTKNNVFSLSKRGRTTNTLVSKLFNSQHTLSLNNHSVFMTSERATLKTLYVLTKCLSNMVLLKTI